MEILKIMVDYEENSLYILRLALDYSSFLSLKILSAQTSISLNILDLIELK